MNLCRCSREGRRAVPAAVPRQWLCTRRTGCPDVRVPVCRNQARPPARISRKHFCARTVSCGLRCLRRASPRSHSSSDTAPRLSAPGAGRAGEPAQRPVGVRAAGRSALPAPRALPWPGCARSARWRGPPPIPGFAQDLVDLGEQFLEIGVQPQQPGIQARQLAGLGRSVTGRAPHRGHHHRTRVRLPGQALMASRSSWRLISILRGLAFSATGITRRSTPSR